MCQNRVKKKKWSIVSIQVENAPDLTASTKSISHLKASTKDLTRWLILQIKGNNAKLQKILKNQGNMPSAKDNNNSSITKPKAWNFAI